MKQTINPQNQPCRLLNTPPGADIPPRGKCSGSALIAVIAAIVIFSVLAAALLPMISSSGQQTAMSTLADKAFLLAESGYRYAVSRYRYPTAFSTDVWDDIKGTYSLSGNDGSFTLQAYGYYFKITSVAANSFTAEIPGTFPTEVDIDQLANTKIHIGDDARSYTIQSAALSDSIDGVNDTITITVDRAIPPAAATKEAYPLALAEGNSDAIANGSPIIYQAGDGELLPLRNGQVNISGRTLTYRINDRAQNQLIDVRDPNDPLMSLGIADGTEVVLNRYIQIASTGTSSSGDAQTNRRVDFYLPLTTPVRYEYKQTFDSESFTTASNMGSHTIDKIDTINPVLKVTSATDGKSLAILDTDVTQEPFKAFRRSSGGYLSYDAQVKIGFYSEANFFPDIFTQSDTEVAAGISFRINPSVLTDDADYNQYGISIMRAIPPTNDTDPLYGLVPPLENHPAIVLWQKTNSGQDKVWLAYKKMNDPPIVFGFEEGETSWSETPTDSNWQITTSDFPNGNNSYLFSATAPPSFSGSIRSPIIPLFVDSNLEVSFWTKDISANPPGIGSYQVVILSSEGQVIKSIPVDVPMAWQQITIDLRDIDTSAYQGQQMMIQFSCNITEPYTSSWYIDDVAITYRWPVQNATLAVRLIESAIIPFTNGGPSPILSGDQVFGISSGASGTVATPPIVSSGTWSNGNATGTLLLNDVSASIWFTPNESLTVVGKGTLAKVNGAPDAATNRKSNAIKVYYANANGYGTANTNPMDRNMLPYPRLTSNADPLQWPIQEGENLAAAQDYYRLVQWDAINSGVANLGWIASTNEPNTILNSYHPDLQSPAAGSKLTSAELGLHSLGANAANVYFDDFGFQLFITEDNNFPSAFQQ